MVNTENKMLLSQLDLCVLRTDRVVVRSRLGAAFTPEMKEAWIKLYDDVQREMMRAGAISEDVGVHTSRSESWQGWRH
jgi:hypothetical protein